MAAAGATASAGAAVQSSANNDAAVGQLIDFDAETPSPGPTNAMANLCMFHPLCHVLVYEV